MIDLSIDQIAYLKCLLDMVILETCENFEWPCYFSFSEISEEDEAYLEENDLIGWHDGWNITTVGEKAYHANKNKLPYYQ